jgi:hypothetical protein
MQAALIAVVVVAAVISRPIEVRLWRAGRLSNRATAVLLLARFPLVVVLFALILGASAPIAIGLTILAMLPAVLFYRFALDLVRDQALEAHRRT